MYKIAPHVLSNLILAVSNLQRVVPFPVLTRHKISIVCVRSKSPKRQTGTRSTVSYLYTLFFLHHIY